MATDDRKIFVDSQYPSPPFVDGIVRVVPDVDPTVVDWVDVDDTDYSALSIGEDAGLDDNIQVPYPLEVIEQKVITSLGGEAEVNGILVIQDIPGISDYEIRVVMR